MARVRDRLEVSGPGHSFTALDLTEHGRAESVFINRFREVLAAVELSPGPRRQETPA